MNQIRLSESEITNRAEWKTTLIGICNRLEHCTARELSRAINDVLRGWGYARKLKPFHVSLWRSVPKNLSSGKLDMRVITDSTVGNALILALENMGAWREDGISSRANEQEKLLALIGLKPVDRKLMESKSKWIDDVPALAEQLLDSLCPDSVVLFDNPEEGPLSVESPLALSLLFRILFQKQATIHIYSNEPPNRDRLPPKTLNSVALLMAVAAESLKRESGERLLALEQLGNLNAEAIWSVCEDVISTWRRHSWQAKETRLPRFVFDFIREQIVVFEANEKNWAKQQRYNPFTLILVQGSKSERNDLAPALLIYKAEEGRWVDPEEVKTYFMDRRLLQVVRQLELTPRLLTEWMGAMGIRLEIVEENDPLHTS